MITIDTATDGPGINTNLRTAIGNAADGDQIQFAATATSNLVSTGAITVGNAITIDGSGYLAPVVISGNNTNSIFSLGGALLSTGTLSFNNVMLTSAANSVITSTGKTNLFVSGDFSVVNSTGDSAGGAIASGSSLVLDGRSAGDLVFSNNSAIQLGGAILVGRDVPNQILLLTGSYANIIITSNTAGIAGGAFATWITTNAGAASPLTISATTSGALRINGNTSSATTSAGYGGGALFTYYGDININGSYGNIDISNNRAINGSGGAITSWASPLTINAFSLGALTITNNVADRQGGALDLGGALTLSGTYGSILINSNTAGLFSNGTSIGAYGGGVVLGGNITINALTAGDLSITNNTSIAIAGGGAIYSGGVNGILLSGTYANVLVNSNTTNSYAATGAGTVGGGAMHSDNSIRIENLLVNGNISFSNNTVNATSTAHGAGGAMQASGSINIVAKATGSLLINNNSVNSVNSGSGNNGGALYAGQINLGGNYSGISLSNNQAPNFGGAAYSDGNITIRAITTGTLQITHNRVTGSLGRGGALYSGGTISVDGSQVSNLSINSNTATQQGGAFYAGNGFYLSVSGTQQFSGNKAATAADGGFLWINNNAAEFNIASGALLKLGAANSIANATDSIGGAASSNVLQSGPGTILYYADNSAYRGTFNLNAGIAEVSNTLNLLGGPLNGRGTLAIDNGNAANAGNDFAFTDNQAAGNFSGVVQLQNSSTLTLSNITVDSPTETVLQGSTLRLAGAVSADPADINGGIGVLVVNQDARQIGGLDLAGGKLIVFGKSPVTAESDVLNVTTLKSTDIGSVVAVDAAMLSGIDTPTGNQWVGPIFDLSGTLSRQIVNATVSVDPSINTGRFALVDVVSGANLTDIASYTFKNSGGSADVGTIHVGYLAEIRSSGSMGLWIGTGVTEIDSTNGNEMVNLNANQALVPGNQVMNAKLSGTGAGFNFTGGAAITLLYLTGNDYTGTTAINGNTTVIAGANSSLGNTRFLAVTGDGSQFDLNGKTQTIGGGLVQGTDALTGAGSLTVSGGTLTITDANTGFSADVNLGGSGTAGHMWLDNLAGSGVSGVINFNDPAAVLTLNSSGTFAKSLNGNGKTVLTPNSDVYATGNNSGFSGTFALQDSSTLHASDPANLGTAAVSAATTMDPALSLENFHGNLVNNLIGNLTVNIIDASAVTLNRLNNQFTGSVLVDNSTLHAGVADVVAMASSLTVNNNGVFDMNNLNQTLQSLSGNNGVVHFGSNNGPFSTLTVGQLSGNLTYDMHVDLGTATVAGTGTGDKIVINGNSTGNHLLRIVNTDGGGGLNTALDVVHLQNPAASHDESFTLQGGTLDGGAFSYALGKGDATGLAGLSNNIYYLYNTGSASAGATAGAAAVLMPQMIWFEEMDTLLKRMGELRLNHPLTKDNWVDNVWVRSYGNQLNVGSEAAGTPFRAYIYGVDLGVDKGWQIDRRNLLYTGVFAGYGSADQDYRTLSGQGGSDSVYGGVYGTWLHDSGWYADLVGKFQYFSNSYDAYDGSGTHTKGDYNNWAAGASLELGRQFKFKDDWFAEPQLQVSYMHGFGNAYTTSGNEFGVHINDSDIFRFRAGSLFGRSIGFTNSKQKIQPYVKVFGQEQISSGGDYSTEAGSTRPNLDGPAAVIGGGMIWQIGDNDQLHLDYEAAFATKYDKPWGVNFGYRHQF